MRSTSWMLPVAALAATGIAVWAGPNLALAIPAAAIAVFLAAVLFAFALNDSWGEGARRGPPRARPEVFRLRAALRSGPMGREALVATLDRVERSGPTPDLPKRTAEEIAQIVDLSPTEFRAYLRSRLDDLEARL
jgi:hypothetical protein